MRTRTDVHPLKGLARMLRHQHCSIGELESHADICPNGNRNAVWIAKDRNDHGRRDREPVRKMRPKPKISTTRRGPKLSNSTIRRPNP